MQATPIIVQTSQALPMRACPFVTNAYLTFVETALTNLGLNTFLIWTGEETRQATMQEALANIAFMLENPHLQPDASAIQEMTKDAIKVVTVMDAEAAAGDLSPRTGEAHNLWLPQLPGWLERLGM